MIGNLAPDGTIGNLPKKPKPLLHVSYNFDDPHNRKCGFGSVLILLPPPKTVEDWQLLKRKILEQEFPNQPTTTIALIAWQVLEGGYQ